MQFFYQAINQGGTMVADTLSMEDSGKVYAELARRGLTPVRIERRDETKSGAEGGGLVGAVAKWLSRGKEIDPRKASQRSISFFTSQLSILLETGTTVASSLSAIERQMSCPHWRALAGHLRVHVEEGGTLASSVAQFPQVFSPIYASMISAGEASGNLSDIFKRLAEFSQQADRLRNKIKSAMIYPALLMCIALVVMVVMLFFVLPRFAAVFQEMKVTLPGSTQTLLGISDFVRRNVLVTVILVVGSVGGVVSWLGSQSGRRFRSRWSLKLPIFGPLVQSLILARMFRLLGLLVSSRVPLLQSLDLTVSATRNYLYVELIRKMRKTVMNGQPMYEVMLAGDLIPPSLAQMVHTGEENGKLDRVLLLLADYLDDRNETKVSMLTSVMEPVILIVMGLVIGTLAISLVLPMFDLSRISS